MLNQEQKQKIVLSQTMNLNLSILQMNRIALNILISKLTSRNPLVKTRESYLPWKKKLNKTENDFLDNILIQEKKIFDELREELVLELEESDYDILYLILGNLSSQGFLLIPIDKLCQGLYVDIERVNYIRNLILESSFLGLASYNVAEYLLFITRKKFGLTSIEYKITEYLSTHNIKRINTEKLEKKLQLSKQSVEDALINIKKLSQSPLNNQNSYHIYPDFIISINNGELNISSTKYNTPQIDIEDYQGNNYTLSELKEFLKEASTIKKAIELRNSSLYNHAKALILARSDFFLDTITESKQIRLKDIAEITGRHISTVSRTLKDRYFIFNNTIYPFSILWNHKIGNSDSYTIKKIIAEIISQENSATPISDILLTNILNKKGIKIARRTVNKYRKSLQIESLYQR